jgi:RNA polymerase sigma-70 factor, ECF subfamily
MVCDGILWTRNEIPSLPIIATMSSLEEKQELDGLRRLDPQVISSIFDRFFPIVFKYVRYRVNDIAQSEDIASDVFVRLLEAVKNGKGPDSNIKAWLLGTASHAVNDHHRKNYRRPTEEISEHIQDYQDTPSETSEQRERQKRIRLALSKLTADQQHVIDLRFGQELSLEETAMVMKKNVNAVKQLQLRALAALNRQIDETL